MSFVWTSDVVEEARRLYIDRGLTATEAARLLGTTPSALIGKVHRMGWAEDRDPLVARANHLRARRATAEWRGHGRRPPSPRDEAADRLSGARPRPWFERRPGQCAFPVEGEGETLLSCCAPCGPRTYCDGHRSVMYLERDPQADARDTDAVARWIDAVEGPLRELED